MSEPWPRLRDDTVARLPEQIGRFGYDRNAMGLGIVHFGIGAFCRAHQAWYTDAAMTGAAAPRDRNWGILGVSLRSGGVAAQLNPQGGLYTVAERSASGSLLRVIGAVRAVTVATSNPAPLTRALAAPSTHIVSLTVTEKGYCRAADGSLDLALARPGSFYDLLARAFRARRATGAGGLTLISCDNLSANGRQLHRLLSDYLENREPDLLAWFDAECSCPGTVVDRIVPATTQDDLSGVAEALGGIHDEAAVMTEPFSQWVIEDHFAGPRPSWEAGGAELVTDVAPYEMAKLRMLNGAHSALAYLGLERGHRFVHEAVADPLLRQLTETLMRQEAATSFAPAFGQDLAAYADSLLARFANPAMNHRLVQIAMDGSQKIPQRWLATLAAHQRLERSCPAILTALASWLRHIRGDNALRVGPLDDPRAAELAAAWSACGESGIVEALFGAHGLLASQWRPSILDAKLLAQALSGM